MTQYLKFAFKYIRKDEKEVDETWMANLDDGTWRLTLLFSGLLYGLEIFHNNNKNYGHTLRS